MVLGTCKIHVETQLHKFNAFDECLNNDCMSHNLFTVLQYIQKKKNQSNQRHKVLSGKTLKIMKIDMIARNIKHTSSWLAKLFQGFLFRQSRVVVCDLQCILSLANQKTNFHQPQTNHLY